MSIDVSIEAHRADIRLARPEVHNAMNWDVFDALQRAVADIAARADVSVAVVSGQGRSFCSGIDTALLAELPGDPRASIARAQAGFRALAACPVPIIAAVHGHALGAGLQLALACDLRVVTRDATLGLLEARYGIIPDLGGTHRLPALVGPGIAKKMIWLGERIDGDEAGRRGLAEVVVDPGDLTTVVDQLATNIAAGPRTAQREVKRLIDGSARRDIAAAMDEEAGAQMNALAAPELAAILQSALRSR